MQATGWRKGVVVLGMVLGYVLSVAGGEVSAAVDAAEAQRLAASFLAHWRADRSVLRLTPLPTAEGATAEAPAGFVVELAPRGFILFGANEAFLPVKAFSWEKPFAGLPPAYRRFLLAEVRAQARAGDAGRQPAAVGRAWEVLRHPERYRLPAAAPPPPLLDSAWGQDAPFNAELARLTGENVLVGCVNVAMGQIMRYWQYPAQGRGVATHEWNGKRFVASLAHAYQWQRMPAVMDGSQDRVGEAEVARLLADLGLANRTAFSTTNSGTAVNLQTLVEQFGYSTAIRSIATVTADGVSNLAAFLAAVQNEIAAKRPMLFSIPGHMGVVDGFDDTDPTGAYAHVNFGWQGTDDGYFYLDRDIVTSQYRFPSQYPFVVYTNVRPCDPDTAGDCGWWGLEDGDAGAASAIQGKIDHPYDADWYPLCLKGDVTATGDRGYAKQAMYLSLYDADLRLVAGGDGQPVAANGLAEGRYWLRVSLFSEQGAMFQDYLDPSHWEYTVAVTGATGASCAVTDRPPEIRTPLPDLVLGQGVTWRALVDARDPEGEAVILSVKSSNPAAVTAALQDEVLTLTPVKAGQAARITVTAAAAGQKTTAAFDVLVHSEPVGTGARFVLAGSFASQDEVDRYQVVLDGQCVIRGDNGYSNQAFYIWVKEQDGATVAAPRWQRVSDGLVLTDPPPLNDGEQYELLPIQQAFGRNQYEITASLRNGSIYYPYQAGPHASYRITVECPSTTATTAEIAALLGIDTAGLTATSGPGLAELVGLLRLLAGETASAVSLEELDYTGDGRLDSGDAAALLADLASG